ncbi:DUF1707 SHOCT-like domain-containing protein [Pseudonocardia acidicola]|uniref:DUF1707 domain-containing protein n=1 Tax=Pseudonocardia acidicola TaxID=2724939 RepID=A0ABX1SAI8_9PSEU|nr:DUF1707 domain-containing protein [Pseudonocardia acidicola]NMH97249.1 DUF1707 domain-containing protein [Pseudonocardia acidicola]
MTQGDTAAGAGDPPPLRIGTAERESAAKALDEHLAAGRLGIEEYADRSAVAANATVASELAALFTDLPAPHPVLPGTAVAPAAGSVPAQQDAAVPARAGGGFLEGWGPRIVTVTPIVATLLFFLTGYQWYWFLLIPAVSALVYGGVGRGGPGGELHRRQEEREERRALRDERRDRRRGR